MKDLTSLLAGKQLLIFDFDGTIADTSPLHAEAFKQVLSPLGISVDYATIAGLKTLDAIRKCVADAGSTCSAEQEQELVSTKQRAVRQMISMELSALPGVDEFLSWARRRYKLSIASSGSRATVALALQKLGYTSWFEPLICAEDVRNAKPDPEPFLTVLKMTGVKADSALVFEDSSAGFSAAQSAGLALVDARRNLWHQLHGIRGSA